MAGGLAELFLPSLGLNSSPVIPANANGTKLCIRNHYQHLCSLPRARCWGSAPRGVQPFIFRQALWKLGRVVYGNVAPRDFQHLWKGKKKVRKIKYFCQKHDKSFAVWEGEKLKLQSRERASVRGGAGWGSWFQRGCARESAGRRS